ncbi:hypothetical protein SprV_0602059100 [Sparganum proliferum]
MVDPSRQRSDKEGDSTHPESDFEETTMIETEAGAIFLKELLESMQSRSSDPDEVPAKILKVLTADRRFPSPGLHFQAANCSLTPTIGSLSLTLNIGFRRSFTWIFVIADVLHAILGSDFLAEFDLLVDCRRARLLDRTTGLFVRRLTPFTVLSNLFALNADIPSPFRELLLRHTNIINPQFHSGEV